MELVKSELMEELAANEHKRGQRGARTMLMCIPAKKRLQFTRATLLANTHYEELTDEMKEISRMRVREILAILDKRGALTR